MEWDKYLPYITAGAGIGLSAIGANKASGQVDKQNDRVQQSQDQLYQLAKAEQAKKEQLTQQFMPQIQQGFRQKPTPMGSQYGQIGSQPQASQAQGPSPSYQAVKANPSGISKASGLIGAGLSLAPGVGSVAGPAMMGVGAIASQFGKNRRMADAWVPQQNAFDAEMKRLPDGSPEESRQAQAYMSAIQQMLQGNKEQKSQGQRALDAAQKYYPSYF